MLTNSKMHCNKRLTSYSTVQYIPTAILQPLAFTVATLPAQASKVYFDAGREP